MTSKAKKVLSILASTIVLAGFTANTVWNTEPTVSAAKKHKKKHHVNKKKHQSKKKATKNKQNTNISSNNNTNSPNANSDSSNSTTIEPQSKYASLADWYAANGININNKYSGEGTQPSQDYENGYDNALGNIIKPMQYNNELYKEGQIIGMTFGEGNPANGTDALPKNLTLAQDYQNSIDMYNSASSFVQPNISAYAIQLTGPNQWGPLQ